MAFMSGNSSFGSKYQVFFEDAKKMLSRMEVKK